MNRTRVQGMVVREDAGLDEAETPSKVEALVHAIEELISQATSAGLHDEVARSASGNLGHAASLPCTPLRATRSMPQDILDRNDWCDVGSDAVRREQDPQALATASALSPGGEAMLPSSPAPRRSVSLQHIAPETDGQACPNNVDTRLGAANLVSPNDGDAGASSREDGRFTDAADGTDSEGSALGSHKEAHSPMDINSLSAEQQERSAETRPQGTPQKALSAMPGAPAAGTHVPARVRFGSIQLGQQTSDAIQRDHESSPWTQFGSFKSTVRHCFTDGLWDSFLTRLLVCFMCPRLYSTRARDVKSTPQAWHPVWRLGG